MKWETRTEQDVSMSVARLVEIATGHEVVCVAALVRYYNGITQESYKVFAIVYVFVKS